MPEQLSIDLTDEQEAELTYARDHYPTPYMRERCAAILEIAKGSSGRQVALGGLLKERAPDTVYRWFHRYETEGLKGLMIKPGRGRKPAFSPRYPDAMTAKRQIESVLRDDPRKYGLSRARWTLSMLLEACPWLNLKSISGLSRLLRRISISYKRGRYYVHSPDQDYEEKCTEIELALLRAVYAPEDYVFLYQDELTYYRQPTLTKAWAPKGHDQALAKRSYRSDTSFRVGAAMNVITGQVIWLQRSKVGLAALITLYKEIADHYPKAKRIYIAQDNWPVHFHADVLALLEKQLCPRPWRRPSNWSDQPSAAAEKLNLPIQLLCLPTYSPWLNPIEKLWRKLKQERIHMHNQSDDWQGLKDSVAEFLDQFSTGSRPLLRYTGLLPD